MNQLALPRRNEEAFRYTDLVALAGLWPVPEEAVHVSAGETRALTIVELGAEPTARALAITLAAGAVLDLRVLNAGAASGRIAITVRLERAAQFTLGAAQVGAGGQVLELVTQVTHAAPDAASRQVVRSVLGGSATGNYLGKVVVDKGADGTDGSQSVRAMLLDRTASANAKPELEIHADDVKCAHGCAVGELDKAALFYLASRGVAPAEARRLMLQAFLAEAFTDAPDEDALCAAALAALEQIP